MNFHHIGIACDNLEKEMHCFSNLGYIQEGEDFVDPIQGIRGRFIVSKNQPRMELLINYGEKGTLDPWLSRSTKMYHVCYEAPDFFNSISKLEKIGAKIIINPVSAIAFDNREITFLMLPNKLLVELVNNS